MISVHSVGFRQGFQQDLLRFPRYPQGFSTGCQWTSQAAPTRAFIGIPRNPQGFSNGFHQNSYVATRVFKGIHLDYFSLEFLDVHKGFQLDAHWMSQVSTRVLIRIPQVFTRVFNRIFIGNPRNPKRFSIRFSWISRYPRGFFNRITIAFPRYPQGFSIGFPLHVLGIHKVF